MNNTNQKAFKLKIKLEQSNKNLIKEVTEELI